MSGVPTAVNTTGCIRSAVADIEYDFAFEGISHVPMLAVPFASVVTRTSTIPSGPMIETNLIVTPDNGSPAPVVSRTVGTGFISVPTVAETWRGVTAWSLFRSPGGALTSEQPMIAAKTATAVEMPAVPVGRIM
jgi:hypothetical protein